MQTVLLHINRSEGALFAPAPAKPTEGAEVRRPRPPSSLLSSLPLRVAMGRWTTGVVPSAVRTGAWSAHQAGVEGGAEADLEGGAEGGADGRAETE